MRIKNVRYFIMAGITAFVLLNIFCLVYYTLPVHITSKTGTTDYIWESYARYSEMMEGYGYGRMNNEGFNNLQDYHRQPVDILIMGSSHMEGTNVPQNRTTAAVLNRLFNGSKYVYNIGISGHNLPHIVNNLETAIQYYRPKEYVVIEIGSILFDIQELEDGVNSILKPIPSYDSKIMFYLQKIPYLRLLYSQFKSFTRKNNEEAGPEQAINIADRKHYAVVLDTAMEKLSRIGGEYAVKIIVFYHPHLKTARDSSISGRTDPEYLKIFEDSCRENNVYFVNMNNVFIDAYKNDHILPHGFQNTAVGEGHLNMDGHRLIAGELFKQVEKIKKDDTI